MMVKFLLILGSFTAASAVQAHSAAPATDAPKWQLYTEADPKANRF